MRFRILFEPGAEEQLYLLQRGKPKKFRKVLKCLGLLELDPRCPGLKSHRYEDYDDVHGRRFGNLVSRIGHQERIECSGTTAQRMER